ncbi:MAG: hypothetical protein ACJ790_22475 [Myxococcaceae bacterium]
MRLLVVDQFAQEAKALRAHFEQRFSEPRRATSDRFVWDLWNVAGQYTALRTPAWEYFPSKLYDAFHQRLVWWGRRTLGCHDVSPPWMSCYIEGCRQEFHGDLPHGPFAFVFSLTNWSRRQFRGGETLLVRDEVLDYWSGFTSVRSLEEENLVREVPSLFNRLLVFDPRIPHGVRRVDGTMDPREGRLVIHGWFVQPRPFIEGPLREQQLQERIDDLTEGLQRELSSGLELAGMLSVELQIAASGEVKSATVLCDTTRSPKPDEPQRKRLVRFILNTLEASRFPKHRAASRVTLPLVFER